VTTNPNDHPDRRSTMTTKTTNANATGTTKLTPTQEAILKAAATRPDGDIEPLPDNVTPGVRQRVIDGMLSRALVMRFPGGIHRISSYGYQCIGMEPPSAEKTASKKRGTKNASPKAAPQSATGATTVLGVALAKTRPGTKQATLLALLSRPEGASIDELAEALEWQRHTVRGTMSHTLKKRLGLTITSEKSEDGVRRYQVCDD